MSGDPDPLLLDEMFTPQIGQLLRERGIDCACVADDPVLVAQDDGSVLDAALVQRRVLVTNNVVDFGPLRRARLAGGQAVPPLIYTDDRAIPRTRDYIGLIVATLEHAATTHKVSAYGGVYWLSPGSS